MKFIGDIHDEKHWITQRIMDSIFPHDTIQLGDLSVCGYDKYHDTSGNRYFIDGNHDCHPLLNHDSDTIQEVVPGLHYIPRGYVSGKIIFIGGGYSIDKSTRTAGIDWYPDEEMSQRQFYKIMNINKSIDVVVAHDCPAFCYRPFFGINDATNQTHNLCLAEIFHKFRPKLWIFGHHHYPVNIVKDDCRFICVDIGQSRSFDIKHNLF